MYLLSLKNISLLFILKLSDPPNMFDCTTKLERILFLLLTRSDNIKLQYITGRLVSNSHYIAWFSIMYTSPNQREFCSFIGFLRVWCFVAYRELSFENHKTSSVNYLTWINIVLIKFAQECLQYTRASYRFLVESAFSIVDDISLIFCR